MDEESLPLEQHINKETLASLIEKWMAYARIHITPIRIKSARLEEVKKRMIDAGYATEDSTQEGELIVTAMAEELVVKEQRAALEANRDRLLTLSRITGRKNPAELKDTTVVSIGGGPGDGICEPWFPRLAALAGAHAINFDYSQAHPLDAEMHLYEHRGRSAGDVFRLLLNEVTLAEDLAHEQNISIIECNHLIGNNVSPDLSISMGELKEMKDDHRIIKMRDNLRKAAATLLMEHGVLAIDDAYYVKREGQLTPVDVNGHVRHTAIFSEEQVPHSDS